LFIFEQRCHFVSKVAADTKTQTVASQSPCTFICLHCMVIYVLFYVKRVTK